MKVDELHKARLIAVEGAAGSGKTTVQKTLYDLLLADGMNVGIIDEFSDSPIGGVLERKSEYGSTKPPWLKGMAQVPAMLSDKLYCLEMAAGRADTIWISDRFLASQLVLGLMGLDDETDVEITREIVALTLSWAARRFHENSFLVILEAPLEILSQRLRHRTGRALTENQLRLLEEEVIRYSSLESSISGWNVVRVGSHAPVGVIGRHLVDTILSTWRAA